MDKWTHTTLFDRPYPPEKRAEGLAISQAIVGGYCDECVFLTKCITQRTFKFPASAWCMPDFPPSSRARGKIGGAYARGYKGICEKSGEKTAFFRKNETEI